METIITHFKKRRNRKYSYLSGEKFKSIADSSFTPEVEIPDGAQIVFCKTDFIHILFEEIRSYRINYIIISHNSAIVISNEMADSLPRNVIRWFAQNADVEHPRIQGIPLGIANSQWPHGDFSRIKYIADKNIPKEKSAYLCANIWTNPHYRKKVYDICRQKKFITVKGGNIPIREREYLHDVASHKFIICPKGKGSDCHRIWEALYLGSYPIVEKSFALQWFDTLPIVFVDDFEQLTEDMLNESYKEIQSRKWNYEMLEISYWEKLIRGYLKKNDTGNIKHRS